MTATKTVDVNKRPKSHYSRLKSDNTDIKIPYSPVWQNLAADIKTYKKKKNTVLLYLNRACYFPQSMLFPSIPRTTVKKGEMMSN